MPAAAATYPGPYDWIDQGIQRYGFHGTSHRYVAQRAASLLGRDLTELKLITCHLGNGCSLAAIKNGHSIDTTMGFTPLDGLMMGSRSGSVDPGILIHLIRKEGYSGDALDQLLNKASGLKGISGVSNDLRLVIEAMEQGNDRAKLAVAMFLHRLRREIGSMLASLGGLDALVFTAGIGENSALIWQKACEPFAFLGLKLQDSPTRSAADQDIAAPDSTIRVLVIHTQEEWAIAQACLTLI
jgi:acetate kinase